MLKRLPGGVKNTLLYGFSIALMKGVSLIMLPILAYFLTAEEFGRLEVITSLAVIGSILVGMGLEATLFRFAGECNDLEQRKQIAAEIFSLALIIGVISAVVSWFVAEFIATHMPGNPSVYEIRLTLFLLSLEGAIAIPLGWLRMHDRVISFFLITTGRALLQALLTAYMLWLGGSVASILEASLIAAVLTASILVYLQLKDTKLDLKLASFKQSLIYSMPLVASGLVAFGLNGLDRWILADYTTLTDVAHFGVAAKFSLAVILLLQPYNMWWTPRRFIVLNQQNGQQKVARFITIGLVLTLIISVLVGLASPLLIHALLPDNYAISAQYVVGMVIVMACKEMADLVNIGCFTGKTTRAQLAINAFAVCLGIAGMLYWTPQYEVWGIIYGLITAQLTRLILFFIISQHFLPLDYPKGPLFLLTSVSLALVIISGLSSSLFMQIISMLISTGLLSLIAIRFNLVPVSMRVQ